jgi:hypothetical protein
LALLSGADSAEDERKAAARRAAIRLMGFRERNLPVPLMGMKWFLGFVWEGACIPFAETSLP